MHLHSEIFYETTTWKNMRACVVREDHTLFKALFLVQPAALKQCGLKRSHIHKHSWCWFTLFHPATSKWSKPLLSCGALLEVCLFSIQINIQGSIWSSTLLLRIRPEQMDGCTVFPPPSKTFTNTQPSSSLSLRTGFIQLYFHYKPRKKPSRIFHMFIHLWACTYSVLCTADVVSRCVWGRGICSGPFVFRGVTCLLCSLRGDLKGPCCKKLREGGSVSLCWGKKKRILSMIHSKPRPVWFTLFSQKWVTEEFTYTVKDRQK